MKFKTFITALLPVILFITVTLSTAFKLSANHTNGRLTVQPVKVKPAAFFIYDVADARADKQAMLALVPVTVNNIVMPTPADLQGSGIKVVDHYLKDNVISNHSLKPIIINVKELTVNETALTGGKVDGKIELSFSFDLKTGEDMAVHLVNYNAGSHYVRAITQPDVAEPALTHCIENALVFFNNWMDKQADTNPLLAKRVELVVSDFEDDKDADTIYYSPKRPLVWDDFKDHPHSARFAAEVIPGVGYSERTSIHNGVIKLEIGMKVFLPKSAAWVRAGNMDDYTLNHEQRHFDIAKIVSEHFKKQLLAEQLPVLNYDGYINVAYFDVLRELDNMQKKYDGETAHGSYAAEQERWNNLIDAQLKSVRNYAAN